MPDFGVSASELIWLAVALSVTGLITGVLAGLLGVGGGAVMVPVLYELFRLIGVEEAVRMHLAVGTSLAVIIPTSVRSFRGHLAKNAVDVELLKQWAAPVIIGVVVGSLVAAFVTSTFLKAVFAFVAGLMAFKLAFGRDSWQLGPDLPTGAFRPASGFGIGVFSAWMGIGGGVFGNAIMTLYGRPIHRAVATSSGLGVLISIPGMIGYIAAGWPKIDLLPPLSLGYVSLIGALLLFPTSLLTVPLGVRLAHGLSKRKLEMAFAVFLALVSTRFIVSLIV
jgi:uncharacterized membrane protein YfcA